MWPASAFKGLRRENMEKYLEALKALADKSRLRIITLLLEHDYCVGALARRIGLTEAAISQHLQLLRQANLVRGEKRGYFTHYSVNTFLLDEISAELTKFGNRQTGKEFCAGAAGGIMIGGKKGKGKCFCSGEKNGLHD